MDRKIWDAYKAAKGAEKKRLSDRLLKENDNLARSFATSYAQQTQYYTDNLEDDLLQACRIGLIRALDGWNPEKGAFSLCAYFWTRHEMQLVVRHATGISVPKSAFLPKRKQDEQDKFATIHGREPEPSEVGITEVAVDRSRKATVVLCPLNQAENISDFTESSPEEIIDRKRDAESLNLFIQRLSLKDKREFWDGRADLIERARVFVEGRRGR